MRSFTPDKINLAITMIGFLFHLGFYCYVLTSPKGDAPERQYKESVTVKQLERIEENFNQSMQEFKTAQQELIQELNAKEAELQKEQAKVIELKRKISQEINTGWDDLSEKEQQAYTDYSIQKITSL